MPPAGLVHSAPQRRTALLLVDVINDMDFEGSAALVRHAEPMARRLHDLKQRARAAGMPDNCVLFSANDAYLRDYQLFIPCDCVASNTREENDAALRLMSKVVKADITPSTELDLANLP